MIRDGSVVLVSSIDGGDKVIALHNRLSQTVGPVGTDTQQIRIHHHHHFRLIEGKVQEEVIEVVALPSHPLGSGEVNLGNAATFRRQEGMLGPVFRKVVNVNDGGIQMRIEFPQPFSHLLDDKANTIGFIEGGNSYDQINRNTIEVVLNNKCTLTFSL